MNQPISGLPLSTNPSGVDIFLLQIAGVLHRAELANLVKGLPVASTLEKGLMSAADKAALNQIILDLASATTYQTVTVASASTVALPTISGLITVVTFTGTTTVTNITGLVSNRLYIFRYPSGLCKGESVHPHPRAFAGPGACLCCNACVWAAVNCS